MRVMGSKITWVLTDFYKIIVKVKKNETKQMLLSLDCDKKNKKKTFKDFFFPIKPFLSN